MARTTDNRRYKPTGEDVADTHAVEQFIHGPIHVPAGLVILALSPAHGQHAVCHTDGAGATIEKHDSHTRPQPQCHDDVVRRGTGLYLSYAYRQFRHSILPPGGSRRPM